MADTSILHVMIKNLCNLSKEKTQYYFILNSLSAKLTKWPNTLKQFVGKLPANFLSMFGHFVGLAQKGLIIGVLGKRGEEVKRVYINVISEKLLKYLKM